MKKLIPLSDFVLEQRKLIWTDIEFSEVVVNYAKFLKQHLTLSMFVPCDEYGNILKEPAADDYSFYAHKNQSLQEEYQEAKEKVLFEGFSLVDRSDVVHYASGITIHMLSGSISMTIEELTEYGFELTPYALQQIGVE